jgi:hypothetical protein
MTRTARSFTAKIEIVGMPLSSGWLSSRNLVFYNDRCCSWRSGIAKATEATDSWLEAISVDI